MLPESPLHALLTLTLVPGLGPVLISRALAALGSPEAVLAATPERLRTVRGIGPDRAALVRDHRGPAAQAAKLELDRASALGITLRAITDPDYPALLRETSDPPPILYIRGRLAPQTDDRFPLAIVGSRACTPYGLEQTARFAGALAAAGITIVSGGARGIDSAAHRAALAARGRTIAVMGCGLAHTYPRENAELFAQIAAGAGDPGPAAGHPPDQGALVSELPLDTAPAADNFPTRNRIISGLSLGVLVVEAAKGSGSLHTARHALEDHNREVFALPGRVDSPASQGALELIKAGEAAMVTHPADILAALETPARHLHQGTHEARYPAANPAGDSLFSSPGTESGAAPAFARAPVVGLTDALDHAIVAALAEPMTIDELARAVAAEIPAIKARLTLLELRKVITRRGPRLARTR